MLARQSLYLPLEVLRQPKIVIYCIILRRKNARTLTLRMQRSLPVGRIGKGFKNISLEV
jgi:hypothetical protein